MIVRTPGSVARGSAALAAGRIAKAKAVVEEGPHSDDEASKIADSFARECTEQALLLGVQQAAFDTDMQCKAENQREANALRDLQMEQMKRDDEIVKKWIELI